MNRPVVVVPAATAEDRWFVDRMRLRADLLLVDLSVAAPAGRPDVLPEPSVAPIRSVVRQARRRAAALRSLGGASALAQAAPSGARSAARRFRDGRAFDRYEQARDAALARLLASATAADRHGRPGSVETVAPTTGSFDGAVVLAPTPEAVRRHHDTVVEADDVVVLSAHQGWLPDHPGRCGAEWALYHRALDRLGATVCRWKPATGEIAVVERAPVTLVPGDDPATCSARVAVLARELLVGVATAWVDGTRDFVAPTADPTGRRSPGVDIPGHALRAIDRDFEQGWLDTTLRATTRF